MPKNPSIERLHQGLQQLGLDQAPADKIWAYLQLLHKWNRAYNLTAVKNIDDMVVRHILDSLSIHAFIQGDHLLDLGTGAGLPGLPLSLYYPDKRFYLLDSNGKKIRFIHQVKLELGLHNIETVQARAEDYQYPAGFDMILSRAVAELQQIIACSQHLLKPNGQWLAMKSQGVLSEINALSEQDYIIRRYPLRVPFEQAERQAVLINKK